MNNFSKVIICDEEGNCLFNDSVTSPFAGLQAGETFWFGSGDDRTWAKVIKITYGLDTTSKCFVIELVIEKTQRGVTKTAYKETEFIDYGQKTIEGPNGGTWSINSGDIIITVGGPNAGRVERISIQVNSLEGVVARNFKDLSSGEFIEVETRERKVICTLISATSVYGQAIVNVTESRFI